MRTTRPRPRATAHGFPVREEQTVVYDGEPAPPPPPAPIPPEAGPPPPERELWPWLLALLVLVLVGLGAGYLLTPQGPRPEPASYAAGHDSDRQAGDGSGRNRAGRADRAEHPRAGGLHGRRGRR